MPPMSRRGKPEPVCFFPARRFWRRGCGSSEWSSSFRLGAERRGRGASSSSSSLGFTAGRRDFASTGSAARRGEVLTLAPGLSVLLFRAGGFSAATRNFAPHLGQASGLASLGRGRRTTAWHFGQRHWMRDMIGPSDDLGGIATVTTPSELSNQHQECKDLAGLLVLR
jgi:hypothetical protein